MQEHDTQEPSGTTTEPTFQAVTAAGVIADAVDAVDALVEECIVAAGPGGLTAAAQDPATVALVSLDLPASAFESYEASGVDLGVDLGRLGDVVGMADADDPVHLALDAESRTLGVRVGELVYTLGLIDPEVIREPPDMGDLSDRFAADVTIAGREVAHFVRAADMVADHLELGATDEGFSAAAEGDADEVRVDHPGDECEAFDVDRGDDADEVTSLFSVSYLDAVAGVVPGDADVRVRFGDGQPVEFTFDRDGGSVRYVVAPRIRKQ